jgi:hypothetical protein
MKKTTLAFGKKKNQFQVRTPAPAGARSVRGHAPLTRPLCGWLQRHKEAEEAKKKVGRPHAA